MACIETCGSIGSYFKILAEDSITTGNCDPATFDANSTRFEILDENVQYKDKLLGGNGLTGGVDPIGAHIRSGTRIVHGRILLEVGPYELDWWLPRILGNANVGDTFETDEVYNLMPFDLMMKRDQGTVIYRHCSVNQAVFRSRASIEGDEQIMQLGVDIIGYEEHDATYPVSEPTLPANDRLYWLLGDGALTLDSTEYYFDAFNLAINNNLLPQTRNFLNITCLQSQGRSIKLQVSTPYTSDSHTDLYISRFDGPGVLNFLGTKNLTGTPSGYVTTFTFARLIQTRQTPATRGHGEIPLSLDLEAFRTSVAEPIVVTNTIA